MCHWIYQILDDKKKKRKGKGDDEEQAKGKRHKTEHQGPVDEQSDMNLDPQHETNHGQSSNENGQGTSSLATEQSAAQDGIDDEMIDKDDGYVVKYGDLMKDGILVAKGDIFDGEHLLDNAVANGICD